MLFCLFYFRISSMITQYMYDSHEINIFKNIFVVFLNINIKYCKTLVSLDTKLVSPTWVMVHGKIVLPPSWTLTDKNILYFNFQARSQNMRTWKANPTGHHWHCRNDESQNSAPLATSTFLQSFDLTASKRILDAYKIHTSSGTRKY